MPTPHYKRVRKFMELADQPVADSPTVPDMATRKLRAALILEEALETIEALGVDIILFDGESSLVIEDVTIKEREQDISLTEIADGCADIYVVTTGTLISCGIDDELLMEEIDKSNLRKFEVGHLKRADGKLIKPPDWTPPNIEEILLIQEWAQKILDELTNTPISYLRLWGRLGEPDGAHKNAYDKALQDLTQRRRIQATTEREGSWYKQGFFL